MFWTAELSGDICVCWEICFLGWGHRIKNYSFQILKQSHCAVQALPHLSYIIKVHIMSSISPILPVLLTLRGFPGRKDFNLETEHPRKTGTSWSLWYWYCQSLPSISDTIVWHHLGWRLVHEISLITDEDPVIKVVWHLSKPPPVLMRQEKPVS